MHCDIYRASTRDEMYVYIARPDYPQDADKMVDPLAIIPADLRKALGRTTFVMHLELSVSRKLARVPVERVLESLQQIGYFVQMPPDGLICPTAVAPEGLRGA